MNESKMLTMNLNAGGEHEFLGRSFFESDQTSFCRRNHATVVPPSCRRPRRFGLVIQTIGFIGITGGASKRVFPGIVLGDTLLAASGIP
jgi:hypothetical protein